MDGIINFIPVWIFQVEFFIASFLFVATIGALILSSSYGMKERALAIVLILFFTVSLVFFLKKLYLEERNKSIEMNNLVIQENLRLKKAMQDSNNVVVITEYKDKIIEIEKEAEVKIKEIPVYITKEQESKCNLDETNILSYHNSLIK